MNDALIYNEKIDLYREPMKICEMLPVGGAQEMSDWQTSFLCGLLRKLRPHKILEVGTYSLSESNRILTIQQGDSPRMNIEKRILS